RFPSETSAARARAAVRAGSRRSAIAIEPEVSTTKTVCGPSTVASDTNGRATESTNRASTSNWAIKSGVSFRGRHGTADDTGSPTYRHSIVDVTWRVRRLDRSMYRTTSGPARAASPNAAGTRNLIAPLPDGSAPPGLVPRLPSPIRPGGSRGPTAGHGGTPPGRTRRRPAGNRPGPPRRSRPAPAPRSRRRPVRGRRPDGDPSPRGREGAGPVPPEWQRGRRGRRPSPP